MFETLNIETASLTYSTPFFMKCVDDDALLCPFVLWSAVPCFRLSCRESGGRESPS